MSADNNLVSEEEAMRRAGAALAVILQRLDDEADATARIDV